MSDDSSRSEFEAWYLENMDRNETFQRWSQQPDYYDKDNAENAWDSWQAGRASKVPQWIPVSERLPEDGAKVVIYSTFSGASCGSYYAGSFCKGDPLTRFGYKVMMATHYMELPAPPTCLK